MIELDNIHDGGGVYVLLRGDVVVYVGKTASFAARIPAHKSKIFNDSGCGLKLRN